jgi:hypothetical protein
MRIKKRRTPLTLRTDDRRPTKVVIDGRHPKAIADAPKYDGPSKSDKRPAAKRGRVKEAFVKADARSARPTQAGRPDMKPPKSGTASAAAPEQYVRLRIRVRGDQLSVVDSHLVDGPLGQANGFPGSNAYEVRLGDRLLHAGALPDLGIQRSFVAPNAPKGQRVHHVTERDVFEFSARVAAHEITRETIGDIVVRLYRVKGEARSERLTTQPLDVQFARELRAVSELRGLPEAALPQAIEQRGARTPRV